ncbi:MAG: polysaccharide biosynthesis/export family protein [Opitutaceae bacterium]
MKTGTFLTLLILALGFGSTVCAEVKSPVYKLSPFDKIGLSVHGEPDLSTEQLITDAGDVRVPLLGPVKVGGLTVAEGTALIERAFVDQKYLRNPVVTLSIEEFAPKTLTVLGEVEKPGTIEIPPGQNGLPIQIAVAEAGGFAGSAKTSALVVTRANPATGQPAMDRVDVDELLQSNGAAPKKEGTSPPATAGYMVRAGDVVFVPRRVF